MFRRIRAARAQLSRTRTCSEPMRFRTRLMISLVRSWVVHVPDVSTIEARSCQRIPSLSPGASGRGYDYALLRFFLSFFLSPLFEVASITEHEERTKNSERVGCTICKNISQLSSTSCVSSFFVFRNFPNTNFSTIRRGWGTKSFVSITSYNGNCSRPRARTIGWYNLSFTLGR